MTKFAPLAALAAAILMTSTGGAAQDGSDADTMAEGALTEGEAKLAKLLEGRVAGEPQSCIRLRPNFDLTVINETALVYKSGRTLYVNVPNNAKSVDDDDTLVRRTIFATQLCNTDIITTVDQNSGFYTGNISLGQFVPYRKEG